MDDVAAEVARDARKRIRAALAVEKPGDEINLSSLATTLSQWSSGGQESGRAIELVRAIEQLAPTEREALLLGAELAHGRGLSNPRWPQDLAELIHAIDPVAHAAPARAPD